MRNSLLPESTAKIIILENGQPDSQSDGPRLQRPCQFCQRIMNVILAITTGTLLLAFLLRYLRPHDSVEDVHNHSMPEIPVESRYGTKAN